MMLDEKKIAVVLPCYKVAKHIRSVIRELPPYVDRIVVVDDACPEGSGKAAEELAGEIPGLIVLYHGENQGVGKAMVTGYRKALELGVDVVVKMDGDGQMDVAYLPALLEPLLAGRAGYVKGNRFFDFKALRAMPKVRLFGNSALSFLVKAASGYWHMMDPTNGYTGITTATLRSLDLERLSPRYFFETDMLINLNIESCVVRDVPIPARYGDEESSLRISRVLVDFPPKLFRGFLRRIFLRYFIYDFNMASIYTLLGTPMILWGFLFGGYRWYLGAFSGVENTAGTVMLAVVPLILGTQFLLQAIQIDIDNTPGYRKG